MSINQLPSEIICAVSEYLDDFDTMSFSNCDRFIYNSLIGNVQIRKKIKEINKMSNEEIEKIIILDDLKEEKKLYISTLQNRKNKGINFKKYYYENGNIQRESWYLNGWSHRPTFEGPAHKDYYANGQLWCEKWWVNGERHRPTAEGPAFIEYYENGHLRYEIWCLNGEQHRPTAEGPAWIKYYENGHIQYEEWYLDGQLEKQNFR